MSILSEYFFKVIHIIVSFLNSVDPDQLASSEAS